MKEGTIISHFGVAVLIEDEKQQRVMIRVKRDSEYVVGDLVFFDERVHSVVPRKNVLSRRGNTGIQRVAANLDALGIVVAPSPQTTENFIDLALVSARNQNIDPFIIATKNDLPEFKAMLKHLNADFGAEIPIFSVSTTNGDGIAALQQHLKEKGQSLLIGVSGAGKSSLVNALVPSAMLDIGDLAPKDKHGKHVTTVSSLHHLPSGGQLIDTPGVRDFKLAEVSPNQIAQHFVGFTETLKSPCRFRNCLHYKEPGCSIKQAVLDGQIDKHRYEMYLALITEG